MKNKHKHKLKNVFNSKGITITPTKLPRELPQDWNCFNVSKTKGIETPYILFYNKVLIIHDNDIKRYIKHIAGVKL